MIFWRETPFKASQSSLLECLYVREARLLQAPLGGALLPRAKLHLKQLSEEVLVIPATVSCLAHKSWVLDGEGRELESLEVLSDHCFAGGSVGPRRSLGHAHAPTSSGSPEQPVVVFGFGALDAVAGEHLGDGDAADPLPPVFEVLCQGEQVQAPTRKRCIEGLGHRTFAVLD